MSKFENLKREFNRLLVNTYDLYFSEFYRKLEEFEKGKYKTFYQEFPKLLESYYMVTKFMYNRVWDDLSTSDRRKILSNTISLYYVIKEARKYSNNGENEIFEAYRIKFRDFMKIIWALLINSH